ncbi:hypothetical protein PHPALM_16886 [Phytophthora palmivora]|uniref:Uncharacterized protein n=1 Tax=Phytophthora palmivora TaxID=4796 RepID=A0A2P4XNT5_9STRA|nr:hypothetical protein PHPALM_16886 [Phytophthora palmivora]
MPNLVEINLRDAAIEDGGMVAIADAFREGGAAKGLTALDVSGNDLTAESMPALGQMLRVSGALRTLQVEENEIGSKGAKAIAKALKIGSPVLEKVVANVNEIGASGALALVKAVVDKNTFAKLDVDGNQISADGVASIETLLEMANVLAQCKKLTLLRYASARAGPEASAQMVRSVNSHLRALKSLDLSDCSFEDDGATQLAEAISKQPNLQYLKLRDASLCAEGAEKVAKALASNKIQLVELDLSGNELADEGIASLAPLLKSQSSLKVLRLDENEVTSEGLKKFVAALSTDSLPVLEELSLCGNEITAKGAIAVVDTFVPSKPALTRLELDTNMISDKGVEYVKASLVKQGKSSILGSLEENDGDEESDDE